MWLMPSGGSLCWRAVLIWNVTLSPFRPLAPPFSLPWLFPPVPHCPHTCPLACLQCFVPLSTPVSLPVSLSCAADVRFLLLPWEFFSLFYKMLCFCWEIIVFIVFSKASVFKGWLIWFIFIRFVVFSSICSVSVYSRVLGGAKCFVQ